MGYVYLSDFYYDNPDIIALSAPAHALYVKALCWQSLHQQGGIIPLAAVKHIGGTQAKRWANELTRGGLWVEMPDGSYAAPQEVNGRPLWKPGPRDTYRRPIPEGLRLAVYDRDGWTCLHCGASEPLSLDHIHPYSMGGPDTIDNLQTLCRPCNSRKGARLDVT
jgi:hypothetical protein